MCYNSCLASTLGEVSKGLCNLHSLLPHKILQKQLLYCGSFQCSTDPSVNIWAESALPVVPRLADSEPVKVGYRV